MVGFVVGDAVEVLGANVGAAVGTSVGIVGLHVGPAVGAVGAPVGVAVGPSVVGKLVGAAEGAKVGGWVDSVSSIHAATYGSRPEEGALIILTDMDEDPVNSYGRKNASS